MAYEFGATDGYLQREAGGVYRGRLRIDGVDLSPITGVYFKEKGNTYLWLQRSPMKEYDETTQTFKDKPREPRWEAYLKKNTSSPSIAYDGMFFFLRLQYRIVAMWDAVMGKERGRLNFYVERLSAKEQHIIQNIKNAQHGE